MSWLRRLFGPRYTSVAVAELGRVDAVADPRVELRGWVELIEAIHSPIDGRAGALIEYRASARSAAGRLHFGAATSAMDLRFHGLQGSDFLLRDDSGDALIRVEPGTDLAELHEDLRAQHGTELDARAEVIDAGCRVRVRGELQPGGLRDPHRGGWRAVVAAHDIVRDQVGPPEA